MSERERFEKWWKEIGFLHGTQEVTYRIWQAALSTRKQCGFVVIDCDGEAKKTFYKSQVEDAHMTVKFFNENDIVGNPFRVVELFYEDQS